MKNKALSAFETKQPKSVSKRKIIALAPVMLYHIKHRRKTNENHF